MIEPRGIGRRGCVEGIAGVLAGVAGAPALAAGLTAVAGVLSWAKTARAFSAASACLRTAIRFGLPALAVEAPPERA